MPAEKSPDGLASTGGYSAPRPSKASCAQRASFSRRARRLLHATAVAALVALVAVTEYSMASSSRVGHLRHNERALVRNVEQAKTTIRFFEHHARLLYSADPRVRRRAWHAVNVARQRVIVGRRDLAWTRKEIRRLTVPLSPRAAIRLVFGPYAGQALRVAACETGGSFSVYASNHGAYLGLFQFGSYARHTYGFDWTALGQARAAWRYFKASGYRWTAWSCQP